MQKRTHKLKALGDVAGVVAAAPSLSAAARQLGVNRSSLHRWMANGKVPRPASRPRGTPATDAGCSPEHWAVAVRQAYELTATEQRLVDLAVEALTMARDAAKPETVRLAAMGRYQRLVQQLNLETLNGATESAIEDAAGGGSWPRPVGRGELDR
jgi:transposase-like protein